MKNGLPITAVLMAVVIYVIPIIRHLVQVQLSEKPVYFVLRRPRKTIRHVVLADVQVMFVLYVPLLLPAVEPPALIRKTVPLLADNQVLKAVQE